MRAVYASRRFAASAAGKARAARPSSVPVLPLAAIYYFAHFLIILPMIARIEKPLPLPNSITEAVLGKTDGAAPAPQD